MDLNIMVAIRDDLSLPTGYHKAVLYALATRGLKAFPNQSQLMRDSGIGSRNTLIKVVKELEELGWLKIRKARHGKNKYWNIRYRVVVPDLIHDVVKYDEGIVKSDTLKINKDKVKINIPNKNQGKTVLKHTSITSSLADTLPVSGIYKGEDR